MAIQVTLRISNDRNVLTIDKISRHVRNKGMACHRVTKDSVEFENEGTKYKIFFDGIRFQLALVFNIGEGASAQMLLMASNQLNLEGCGVKASMNIDANNPTNNLLVFSVDGFCHRPKDFEMDFDYSMQALKGGVERHRSICEHFTTETDPKPTRRKIGFIQHYEK